MRTVSVELTRDEIDLVARAVRKVSPPTAESINLLDYLRTCRTDAFGPEEGTS